MSAGIFAGWPLIAGQLPATSSGGIVPAILAIAGAAASMTVGDNPSFTPTITGGTAPYTVTATGLAPGRSITNAATGLTTGTYTTAGSYSTTYTVVDSGNPQQTASFVRSVTVAAAVVAAALVPVSAVLDSYDSLTDQAGNARTAQGSASGVAIALDTSKKILGTNAVQIQQTGSTNVTMGVNTVNVIPTGLSLVPATDLGVVAFYRDIPEASRTTVNGGSLILTSGGKTDTYAFSENIREGGSWIASVPSDRPNLATVTTPQTVMAANIRLTQATPYGSTAYVDSLIRNAKGVMSVVFTTDDIYDTQYTNWWPALKTYGFKGAMYVPSGFIGNSGRCTKAQLDEMYNSTVSQIDMCRDGTSGDVSVPDDTSLTAYKANDDALTALGYTRGSKHMCWPNGVVPSTATAQALQAYGVRTCRAISVNSGVLAPMFLKHGWGKGAALNHPTLGGASGSATAFTDYYKPALDRAREGGFTVWHFGHGYSNTPDAIGCHLGEFQKMLDYIAPWVASGECIVETPAENFARVNGYTIAPTIYSPRTAKQRIGVNLAGAEQGANPGVENTDWVRPTVGDVDYFTGKGLSLMRYCMQQARMTTAAASPTLTNFTVNQTEVDKVRVLAARAGNKGSAFLLDLHNYAKLTDGTPLDPTNADHVEWLARFWGIMATAFKDMPHVWYGISNEPNVQTPANWVTLANAAIARIASIQPTATVLVSGSAYDVAAGWVSSGNAAAMANVSIPAGITVYYEAHQYGDQQGGKPDAPNNYPVVVDEFIKAQAFFDWARTNNKKVVIGEFGFTSETTYMAEAKKYLDLCATYQDVIIGNVVWYSNKWATNPGVTRRFNIRPADTVNGPDLAQMGLLTQYV
jgi:aryl-phospho-beta-D-glucosidase BglC (GH1 family)